MTSVDDLMQRFDAAIDLSMSYSIPEPNEIPPHTQPYRPSDMFGHLQSPLAEEDEFVRLKAVYMSHEDVPADRVGADHYLRAFSADKNGSGSLSDAPQGCQLHSDSHSNDDSKRSSHDAETWSKKSDANNIIGTPASKMRAELSALRNLTASGFMPSSDEGNLSGQNYDHELATERARDTHTHAQAMETHSSTAQSMSKTWYRGDSSPRSLPDHELCKTLQSPAQRPADHVGTNGSTTIRRMYSSDGVPTLSNFRQGSPFQRIPRQPTFKCTPLGKASGQIGGFKKYGDEKQDEDESHEIDADVEIHVDKMDGVKSEANETKIDSTISPTIEAGLNRQASEGSEAADANKANK